MKNQNRPALLKAAMFLAERGIVVDGIFQMSVKTNEFFATTLRNLITSLYNGRIGEVFITILFNLVQGQLTQAFSQAMTNAGLLESDMLPEWQAELDDTIANQQSFIPSLFEAVIDARLDGRPLSSVIGRAALWANQWDSMFIRAGILVAEVGEKKKWIFGDAEHCSSCLSLNGVVAFASEWDKTGVQPRNAPNAKLECGGWRCKCRLEKTTQRRSPLAISKIEGFAKQ